MITLRHSLFETNSSSTHALVVPKDEIFTYDLDSSSWDWDYNYCFDRQDYRILQSWDQKLAYLYIVLLEIGQYCDVVSPIPDLPKFKLEVSEMYFKLCRENDYELNEDDTLPEHIFRVIDFLNGSKNEDEKEKLLSELPWQFEYVIQGGCVDVNHPEPFIIFSDDDTRERKPCFEFLKKCLDDPKYLEKFLFNDKSYITIGGDEYRGYNLKTIGFEYDYDNEEEWKKKVLEYEENYEVYFKGN